LEYVIGARAKQAKTIFTVQHCIDNLDKRYDDDDLINVTGYLDGLSFITGVPDYMNLSVF
jgi:hypothetical protein